MRGSGSWLARESVQTQSLDKASYDNQVLVLSENDVQKFVEMMQNPPKLSHELAALLRNSQTRSPSIAYPSP
jgi:uncharacterized protein (DUF1778 family)